MVTRGRSGGWGEGELDGGSQKGQTCSCKINTRDVLYNMINIINPVVYEILYMKVVKRVNPEFSSQEKNFVFYSFNFVFI